jgi:UDP-glucose 4-epimerase
MSGVEVVEFSMGFGPRIFSTVRGGTRYSFKALLFGGSCEMKGMYDDLDEEEPAAAVKRTEEGSFQSAPIGKRKRITRETPVSPANAYGDSKVQAEKGILPLDDASFKVVVLRPPMIYGQGSKGNYPILAKLAGKCPVFPYVKNERSMLYVGNLCEFVRLMIANEERGVFWPQNAEYSVTSELVKAIAAARGKRVRLVPGFGWALKALSFATGLVNKAFGNLSYDQSLSEYKTEYRLFTLQESIEETEK